MFELRGNAMLGHREVHVRPTPPAAVGVPAVPARLPCGHALNR